MKFQIVYRKKTAAGKKKNVRFFEKGRKFIHGWKLDHILQDALIHSFV